MSSVAHHVQLIPAEEIDAVRQAFPDEEVSTQAGAPFGMKRELLMSPLGIPCTPPPWGVLAGVDLASGEIDSGAKHWARLTWRSAHRISVAPS